MFAMLHFCFFVATAAPPLPLLLLLCMLLLLLPLLTFWHCLCESESGGFQRTFQFPSADRFLPLPSAFFSTSFSFFNPSFSFLRRERGDKGHQDALASCSKREQAPLKKVIV